MTESRAFPALLTAFASVLIMRFVFIFLDLERIQSVLQPQFTYDFPRVREVIESIILPEDDVPGTTTPIDTPKRPSCFQYNSEEWLKGPRFGNIREGITDEMTQRMLVDLDHLLEAPHHLLGQSMCMKDSRFVTRTDETDANDAEAVRIWAVRLSYLAFHYHQNRLAQREAKVRLTCTATELEQHDIGPFDFECSRDTKYAIFDLAGIGIGANIRGGAAVALMMGLLSDRIVLFINKAPAEASVFSKASWPLVSCDRGDHQCFFFPSSPCVLTIEDLNSAWIMPKHDSRMFLTKEGLLPEEHKDDRIIRVVSLFQPFPATPKPVMEKLSKLAHEIIDQLPDTDPRIAILRKAADSIAILDADRDGYHYAASTHKVAHAAAIYAMRPNPIAYNQLHNILDEVVPDDLNVEASIGLPIRASDKCLKESECLSFDEHMQVVDDLWQANKHESDVDPTIVFTTESKSVLADQLAYVNNTDRRTKFRHTFNFVTNTKDVTPDTGLLKMAHRFGGADEVMLSAMSSLMFQMKPRYSIGNCCSNFHILLADYLYSGCGSASSNTFMCLQEHPNPLLRVCCGWRGNCQKEKQAALEALAQNRTIISDAAGG
ncbi:hypothetical protein FisN_11Lh259 [Fistulifera solaris]|uniref:Uncharacterized protein n=1 Tax=Fistulifera solaris TaxID=1519565 RepID=A0A1Z5J6Z1_FISSO|nr:hypothetical protein FisN_11Lh259 [Fistulifera solaris]|eukprot:GAX09767.1 hypothetical protein FisN_11Lh259 [Fistulifera solaris]